MHRTVVMLGLLLGMASAPAPHTQPSAASQAVQRRQGPPALAADDLNAGTAEGNRRLEELLGAPSIDILRLVFGPKAYPESRKTGLT